MGCFVFLPQQQSSDTGTRKLGVQLGEIHLRGTRQRHFTPIQPLVQLYFIEPGRQWPAHARLSATLHAFLYRRDW